MSFEQLLLVTGAKILSKMESKNKNEENLSELTKRFLEEVERMGVSFYNIAKNTGVQEAMFTKIKRGIQEPSKKFLSKFAECYPDANMEYIYLGNKEEPINAYSERFLQVIDKLGVTDYFVWNNCDAISKAQMSHIRTGKGGASLSIIEAFCNQFPQVNANYILTGKGSMFLNNDELSSSTDIGTFGLTYDELARLYETTVSRYERLIENMKMKFETLEHAFVDVKETFDRESA